MNPKRSMILTLAILGVGLVIGFSIKPAGPASALPAKSASSRGASRDARPAVPDIDLAVVMTLAKDIETAGPGQDGKRTPESMRQQELLTTQIYRLTPGQIRKFITDLSKDSEIPAEGKAWFGFQALQAMSEKDSGGALDLAAISTGIFEKSSIGKILVGQIVKRVAQQNPTLALGKVKALVAAYPGIKAEGFVSVAADGAASKNPEIAFQAMKELYGTSDPGKLKEFLTRTTLQISSNEARLALLREVRTYLPAMADEAQKDALQKTLFSGVTYRVVESGFESAQGWIKQAELSPEEQWMFFNCLQENVAKGDAGRWIEWFNTIPAPPSYAGKNDREARNSKARTLVREWAGEDHIAAGNWLETLPEGDLRSYAVNGYVCAIAAKLPEKAAEWALTLPDEENRSSLLKTIHAQAEWKNHEESEVFAKRFGIE